MYRVLAGSDSSYSESSRPITFVEFRTFTQDHICNVMGGYIIYGAVKDCKCVANPSELLSPLKSNLGSNYPGAAVRKQSGGNL